MGRAPSRKRRRIAGAFVLGVALLCCVWSAQRLPAQSPIRLYAYASEDLSHPTLRRRLETDLAPVQLSVFGRLRDFRQAVENEAPDAVLARKPLLDDMGLAVTLQGYSRGTPSEPYVLVNRGAPIPLSNIPRSTVGVVDLLGPHKMDELVRALLANQAPTTLRRVTKLADLVGMLRLDLAQAVVLPARLIDDLKAGSEMQLAVTPLEHAEVGHYALHISTPSTRQLLQERFRKLSTTLNRNLGVDEWR